MAITTTVIWYVINLRCNGPWAVRACGPKTHLYSSISVLAATHALTASIVPYEHVFFSPCKTMAFMDIIC